MTPLTPEFIALILHYIVPPSQLSPLPPHLLSSSLRQRHHFLQISPDHPASYLAWPSNSHLAIHLLEDVPKPIDDISFPVRYTSDAESAYAHVSILPEHPHGLRLVFQWNSPDGWKYHNLALMPFPPHSSESPQDTLQQSDPEYIRMGDQVDTDAAYWDAYTHPDEDAPPITVADSDPQRGAEDSYWSQYAAIHGSGDSTPSSLAQKHTDLKRVFVLYPGPLPTTVLNPLDPPSPNALARRLADLSPRLQSPPPLQDSNSEPASDSSALSLLSHPPLSSSTASLSIEADTTTLSTFIGASCARQQEDLHTEPHHVRHEALADAIRGVYRLWKSARHTYSVTQIEERDEFLGIVRQVVAESTSGVD